MPCWTRTSVVDVKMHSICFGCGAGCHGTPFHSVKTVVITQTPTSMPATVLLAHRSITALQLVHPRLCQRPRCCPALQTTSWQLPARPAAQGAAGVRVWASAAAATGGTPFEPSKPRVQQESRLPALLTPLSDPTANAKLLALCFGECSVMGLRASLVAC